jgi:hypothetical protein
MPDVVGLPPADASTGVDDTMVEFDVLSWDTATDAVFAVPAERYMAWLGTVCGECVSGGYGQPCTKHFLDADDEFRRATDD